MHIYSLFIAVGLFATVSHAKYANQDFPQGTIRQLPNKTEDVGNTDEEGVDDGDYADFEDYGDYEYLDAYFGPGNEHLLLPSENETHDESMYEDPDDYTFHDDLHSSIEAQSGENEPVDIFAPDVSPSEDNSVKMNPLQDADVNRDSEKNRDDLLSQDRHVMVAERYKRNVNNRRSKLQRQTIASLEENDTNIAGEEEKPHNRQPSPSGYTEWSAGVVPEPSKNGNDLNEPQAYTDYDYDMNGIHNRQGNRKTLRRKPNAQPKPNISKNRVPPRRVTDRSRLPNRSNNNQGSPPRNRPLQGKPRKSPQDSRVQNPLVNRKRITTRRVVQRG